MDGVYVNYYVLLGLDPDHYHPVKDRAAIESAINAKRLEWSKARKTRDKEFARVGGALRKQLLSSLSGDPDTWLEHAREAREAAKEQSKWSKQLCRDLADVLEDPVVSDEGWKKFKSRLSSLEDPDLFLKTLGIDKASELKVNTEKKSEKLAKGVLPSIVHRLDALGFENLYTFMYERTSAPCDSSMSPAQLVSIAEQIEAACKRTTDPIPTMHKELAGLAKRVFDSESEKQKYDYHLLEEKLVGLSAILDAFPRNSFISRNQADRIIAKGVAISGMAHGVVETYTQTALSERAIVVSSASTKQARELCSNCQTPISKTDEVCTACGADQFMDCFNCDARIRIGNSQCIKCGVPKSIQSLARSYLAQAKTLLGAGQFADAESLILKAVGLVPTSVEVKNAQAEISGKATKSRSVLAQIRSLISEGKLRAAQNKLNVGVAFLEREEAENVQAELDDRVSEANKALVRLRQTRTAITDLERLRNYARLASAASDLEEVIKALKDYAPPLPDTFSVHPKDECFILSWDIALEPSSGIEFVLIRSDNPDVKLVSDGPRVYDGDLRQIKDDRSPIGEVFWYALFSKALGRISPSPKVCGPFFRTASVSELSVRESERNVEVEWKLPSGASDAIVYKCPQGTKKIPVNTAPYGTGLHSFIDDALKNRETATYFVVSRFFRNGEEQPVFGAAKRIEGKLTLPPSAISGFEFSASGHNGKGEFYWAAEAASDEVEALYFFSANPGLNSNRIYDADVKLNTDLVMRVTEAGRATVPQLGMGSYWALLSRRRNQKVRFSDPLPFASASPVSDLKVRELTEDIAELSWVWPDGSVSADFSIETKAGRVKTKSHNRSRGEVSATVSIDLPSDPCQISVVAIGKDSSTKSSSVSIEYSPKRVIEILFWMSRDTSGLFKRGKDRKTQLNLELSPGAYYPDLDVSFKKIRESRKSAGTRIFTIRNIGAAENKVVIDLSQYLPNESGYVSLKAAGQSDNLQLIFVPKGGMNGQRCN